MVAFERKKSFTSLVEVYCFVIGTSNKPIEKPPSKGVSTVGRRTSHITFLRLTFCQSRRLRCVYLPTTLTDASGQRRAAVNWRRMQPLLRLGLGPVITAECRLNPPSNLFAAGVFTGRNRTSCRSSAVGGTLLCRCDDACGQHHAGRRQYSCSCSKFEQSSRYQLTQRSRPRFQSHLNRPPDVPRAVAASV